MTDSSPVKNRTLLFATIAVLLAALVWLAFFWSPKGSTLPGEGHSGSAGVLAGKPPGGDFVLQSPDGPLSLTNYRGKVVLIYFGYTFCPDVCPTALSLLAQALSGLTSDELEKTQGIFISVDPERDTMEVLKAYPPFFHPK